MKAPLFTTARKANKSGVEWATFGKDLRISNYGTVYDVKAKRLHPILTSQNGHLYIRHQGKIYWVHRVVYSCFKGHIPEGKVVDHIDGCKTNNKITNLQLLTQSENIKKSLTT